MRRSTWFAVLLTALVLAGGGLVTPRAPAALSEALAQAGPAAVRLLLGSGWLAARIAVLEWTPLATAAALGAAAAAALAVLAALLARRPRRPPRHAVRRLARRGRSVAAVARRTGLAQDAVRSLLRTARPRPEHRPC
jgi:hypothetical protein